MLSLRVRNVIVFCSVVAAVLAVCAVGDTVLA